MRCFRLSGRGNDEITPSGTGTNPGQEFRRDHAAALKEGIAFQKEIVALREEEYRVFQKSLEADPSLRLEAYRSQEAGLAAKCRLLEMESRVRGEKQ